MLSPLFLLHQRYFFYKYIYIFFVFFRKRALLMLLLFFFWMFHLHAYITALLFSSLLIYTPFFHFISKQISSLISFSIIHTKKIYHQQQQQQKWDFQRMERHVYHYNHWNVASAHHTDDEPTINNDNHGLTFEDNTIIWRNEINWHRVASYCIF